MTQEQLRAQWEQQASQRLVGRTITAVHYLPPGERDQMMWDRSCVVLVLDDGNTLLPSQDDEGNGPGVLFTSHDDLPVIPVI